MPHMYMYRMEKREEMMIFLWIFITFFCFRQSNSLVEQPLVTYEALYQVGMDFYTDKNWEMCVIFINKALEDYYFYKENTIKCRLDCKDKQEKSKRSLSGEGEKNLNRNMYILRFFESFVYESNCVKRCHKKVFGERPEPKDRRVFNTVERDFQIGRPYHVLQFCYYQQNKMEKAASAAYTYFLRNPNDTDTRANLQLYREKVGVQDEKIEDLARKPYQKLHIEGDIAYGNEEWTTAIEKLEGSLVSFYEEERGCRAECEGFFDHGVQLPDFIHAVSEHFISVLECQYNCEENLSRIFVDHYEDFVPEHYNFLQYAYYKSNNFDKAVEAAATYLMFKPYDPEMLRNKIYYISRLGYHDAHFVPRKEAREYMDMRESMTQILDYVNRTYRANYTTEADMDLEKLDEEEEEEGVHYMKVYERLGIELIADNKGLKGYRFWANGFLREEQCTELLTLLEKLSSDDAGYKSLDIPSMVELVKKNEDREISLRIFVKASEIARHYTARYFNQTLLFIKDTKLLCQEPNDQDKDCIRQESGMCLSQKQLYSTNDDSKTYQSVLYLTDHEDVDGIQLMNEYREQEAVVYPACGRMVGYLTAEKHQVQSLSKRRCSLVLNFTTDRSQESLEPRVAMTFLNKLDESRIDVKEVNNTEYMKEMAKQGVKITLDGESLHGESRFVADGLVSPEECQTLIQLARDGAVSGDGYMVNTSPHTVRETFVGLPLTRAAQSGGQQGDGYIEREEFKGKISPHTNYEIFEGLSVSRASKLAYVEAVNKKWVETFLSVSDKGRKLVEKYFNLTRPLYFDYTHLVCRKAVDGEQDGRSDLSHPVHADNCVLQADGTCLRQFPAYTHRDYSAIIYLNGQTDFEGGEFFFAYDNSSEQISLEPKCGRLVGFDSGEYHGVKAVTKGQRCAVALWFTMDPNHREIAHLQAKTLLDKLNKGMMRERSEKETSTSMDIKVEENKSQTEENLVEKISKEIRKSDQNVLNSHDQQEESDVLKGDDDFEIKEGDDIQAVDIDSVNDLNPMKEDYLSDDKVEHLEL